MDLVVRKKVDASKMKRKTIILKKSQRIKSQRIKSKHIKSQHIKSQHI